MMPEIAVMLNPEGMTTGLTSPGAVAIYTRRQSSWEPARIMPFSLDSAGGIAEVREKIADLIVFLGECRIFVTRAVSGAIFFELQKAGCGVWEIHGAPHEFLEQVWTEEEKQSEALPSAAIDIPVPVEIGPGQYYISIRDIQGKHPEVSSKQVLQKFIRNGRFHKLEVICDHVPPWIALESSCCEFTMQSDLIGRGEVKLILTKNPTCTS